MQHGALGTGLGTPGECLQPRTEFADRVGFRQVVVTAGLQPGDPLVDIVERAEDQHRCHVAGATQLLDDRQSVAFRQHAIDDHCVVGIVDGQLQAMLAIGSVLDRMATLLQALDQVAGGVDVVFD